MTASELFQAGRLTDAIAAQVQEVKTAPADMARRLFLFELLAFTGDLDRARRQVEALNYDEPELQMAAANYRRLLDAEQARRRLFRDGVPPRFLAPPPDHVRLRLEAVNHLRERNPAAAAEVLARANADCPAVGGALNDRPVGSVRDCDDLFGPVLEVMANGEYVWVPLEQVGSVALNPPRFPRDLIWAPARLELDGATGEMFLPALYPGTHEATDDQLRLGRMTDWRSEDGGPVLGVGGRLFLADDDPVGLLEWRKFTAA